MPHNKASDLELLRAYREEGNFKARNELIMRQQKRAHKFAAKYHKRFPQAEIQDLYQEAFFGLIRAADKFNERNGTTFGTYAHYWIRSYLSEYVSKNLKRAIHIPSGTQTLYFRLKKKGDPTKMELTETLRDAMLVIEGRALSLETTCGDNEPFPGNVNENALPNQGLTGEQFAEKKQRAEMLARALRKLTVDERWLVKKIIGDEWTLRQVRKKLQQRKLVSQEFTVKQTEEEYLRIQKKLRFIIQSQTI